ncbi:MAG: reverse gyrase [Sulfolobales archaeon]
MLKVVFKHLCPNCGREDISSERLDKGLACEKCMPVDSALVREGLMKAVKERDKEVEYIDSIFREFIKAPMWGLQRFWVRRFIENESFAMIAPTGSGKTTTQIILSIYAATKLGKRVLILLPTSVLAYQVQRKILELVKLMNLEDSIVAGYHSYLRESEKKENLEKINKARIIVTTTMSLMRRPEIYTQRVDIAFIDDVDSFLRRSKSIDFVLDMLGIDRKLREDVERIIERERELRKLARTSPDKYEEELKKIIEARNQIRGRSRAQIIVSGATQTTRKTKRIILLETLIGFTTGRRIEVKRRVIDSYVEIPEKETPEKKVLEIVKKLGSGGIIFIPLDIGAEYADKLEKILIEHGIKARNFLRSGKKAFDQFASGEIDVLIGIASTRSPLTRGIDLPEVVRYAVFVGVPKFKIRIDVNEFHPARWLILLNALRDVIPKQYQEEADFILGALSNVRYIRSEELEKVRESLKKGVQLEGFLEYVRKVGEKTMKFFERILSEEDSIKALEKSPFISFSRDKGEYIFIVPDTAAYLQASGRTSRLYAGGVTLGLSVLLVDDVKAFNLLIRDMKWYVDEVSWSRYEDLDIDNILKEIDLDRERVRLIKSGKAVGEFKDLVKTKLFIVESPNKARTIGRLFGKPVSRVYKDLQTYETMLEDSLLIVTASGGHIVDLVQNEGLFGVLVRTRSEEASVEFIPVYTSLKRCANCGRTVPEDVSRCPYCRATVFRSMKPYIEALRILASQVDEVLIGTDPDSEGEKIAWDLYLLLKPFNSNIKRVRFHEVTRRGILEAIRNPEKFDENMIKAQIIRRIEDRWIGYSLSPILWKEFKLNYLSAGRVQTPVLGFVVERSREASKKVELIDLELENGTRFVIRAPKGTYERILKEGSVKIKDLTISEEIINPPPPFTTDSLLMQASSSLKAPTERIMKIAQKLFELGLITYHRTDSTTISTFGLNIAREYISTNFGDKYFIPRKWESPGAHEGIRPTRAVDSHRLRILIKAGVIKIQGPLSEEDLRVYDMIFRRFIASQMPPAKVLRMNFKLVAGGFEQSFSVIKDIIDPGFTLVQPIQISKMNVSEGEYAIKRIEYKLISEKPLYTYSDLVSLMKENGIGRPSTYATIIETLRRRRYITEIPRARSKVTSTKLGNMVYEYLSKNYQPYINIERTRELEKKMDLVEEGKIDYNTVLTELYKEIKKIINDAVNDKGVEYPNLNMDLLKKF